MGWDNVQRYAFGLGFELDGWPMHDVRLGMSKRVSMDRRARLMLLRLVV